MPLIETQPDAVAQIYAQSLFDLAMQAGGQPRAEEVLAELEDIIELARSDRQFGEFLSSRIVASKDRDASLVKIFQGRASEAVVNFLRLLNSRGRLVALTGIVSAFDRLVQNSFGRVEVDVFTATPLSGDDQQALRAKLKGVLGKEPILHPYTDASIIGGIRLQIADRLIDASVSTALRKIRDQLTQNGLPAVRAATDRIMRTDPSDNGH
ncbi:MAG: ATP synthase F1 subunit delta [Phycisphaerales bacterium]